MADTEVFAVVSRHYRGHSAFQPCRLVVGVGPGQQWQSPLERAP